MTAHLLPQRPCTLGPHKDDGYVFVTETVTETVRIIYRPPTPEEAAVLRIAEGSERMVPRYD